MPKKAIGKTSKLCLSCGARYSLDASGQYCLGGDFNKSQRHMLSKGKSCIFHRKNRLFAENEYLVAASNFSALAWTKVQEKESRKGGMG